MRIQVDEGPVRENIEVLLNVLSHIDQEVSAQELSTKVFDAWVNRETGKLFSEGSTSSLGKKDWKQIEICCVYDPEQGEVCFLVEEPTTKKKSFRYDDLTPQALSIIGNTLKVINKAMQRLKGPSDLQTKMSVMSKIEIDRSGPHANRNILNEAWHPSDRFQAEAILWDKPTGTYLFRKDPYAEFLEQQLQRQLNKKVMCFTLTYSQADRKFSDLTLVHCEGTWLIYDDDPSLEQPKFNEIMDLLSLMKDVLKYPLYHKSR
jgi:hypothetical protein